MTDNDHTKQLERLLEAANKTIGSHYTGDDLRNLERLTPQAAIVLEYSRAEWNRLL